MSNLQIVVKVVGDTCLNKTQISNLHQCHANVHVNLTIHKSNNNLKIGRTQPIKNQFIKIGGLSEKTRDANWLFYVTCNATCTVGV